jgi:hypothetical protein
VEKSVEYLDGETEVLGKNLPQYSFVNHKSHMTLIDLEDSPLLWRDGD